MKFALCNPTDIRFGIGQIKALRSLVPAGSSILLLYGGGSIKTNGVHDQVMAALADCTVVEFGGVEPNPLYETLQRAAGLVREHTVDLVLGVGGGSVADAAKFLATMIPMGGNDPWPDLVAGKLPDKTIPVGIVLTLAATGSESNPTSVISSTTYGLKLPFANQDARPRFAILDPSTMATLSRRQLENGVVNAFTHVLEQYMTREVNAPIQYGFSETIMKVLAEWGPQLIHEPSDEARENIMWAANQALNGLIGAGVPQDWSTHMIGHAITAIYGIDHARTLSAVMPALMRERLNAKAGMLARYGRSVWGIIEVNDREAALLAIGRTEAFFAEMGCPIRTSQFETTLDHQLVVDHLVRAGHVALGEGQDIDPVSVKAILARS